MQEPTKGERWVGENTRVSNELLAKMILAHARMTAAAYYNSRSKLYEAGARLAEFAKEAGITVDWL
jgi:hypothetical protein